MTLFTVPLLPSGWSLAAIENSATPATITENGSTDLLEWTWNSLGESPLTFAFALNVPVSQRGQIEIVSLAEVTTNGNQVLLLAAPDPLELQPGLHSADTNGDLRLGLSELLRVIELYNTRTGTSRTGRYRLSETSKDGFDPDGRTIGDGEGPTRFHSADMDRNGQLSLSELLRVIELYNTRSGTTRTGAYRIDADTSDGFSSDA